MHLQRRVKNHGIEHHITTRIGERRSLIRFSNAHSDVEKPNSDFFATPEVSKEWSDERQTFYNDVVAPVQEAPAYAFTVKQVKDTQYREVVAKKGFKLYEQVNAMWVQVVIYQADCLFLSRLSTLLYFI